MNTIVNPEPYQSISKQPICSINIPLPPIEVNINKVIGGLYNKIAALERRITSLESLLDQQKKQSLNSVLNGRDEWSE